MIFIKTMFVNDYQVQPINNKMRFTSMFYYKVWRVTFRELKLSSRICLRRHNWNFSLNKLQTTATLRCIENAASGVENFRTKVPKCLPDIKFQEQVQSLATGRKKLQVEGNKLTVLIGSTLNKCYSVFFYNFGEDTRNEFFSITAEIVGKKLNNYGSRGFQYPV